MSKLPSSISPRKASALIASGAREVFIPVHPEYARDTPVASEAAALAVIATFCAKYGEDPSLGRVRRLIEVTRDVRVEIADPEGYCRLLTARRPVRSYIEVQA